MVTAISEGVQITVETFYQPEYSNPVNSEFMFAYRVTIENCNAFTIKLLHRHWYVFDSRGDYREVDGEGVVGVQPILKSNEKFVYVSGCNLRTEIGRMEGYYLMENQNSKEQFKAKIPAFEMVVPNKMN